MRSSLIILLSYVLLTATPVKAAERLSLNVITPEAFCSNLVTSLVDSPLVSGNNPTRIKQAVQASGKFVRLLKAGILAPILPVSQLGLSPRELEPENPRYVSMTSLLAEALKEGDDLTLAFDVAELRFLPYSLQNNHILLLVKDTHELSPERAKLVMHVAKRLQIKVSAIWYGLPSSNSNGPQTGLAVLTAMTGGKFIDLNWITTDCGAPSS